MARVEIVPDEMGGFEIYGKKYEVSASSDIVMRFVDPELDYLHYLDAEEKGITVHWLGSRALATLVEYGIPETKPRRTMQNCEYEEYIRWCANYRMGQFEEEIEE